MDIFRYGNFQLRIDNLQVINLIKKTKQQKIVLLPFESYIVDRCLFKLRNSQIKMEIKYIKSKTNRFHNVADAYAKIARKRVVRLIEEGELVYQIDNWKRLTNFDTL